MELLAQPFLDLVESLFDSTQNDSVRGLNISVCLRMLDGGELLCGAEVGYEFLEVFVRELGSIVDENCLGDAETSEDFLVIET